ncbi:MAG TPA: malto-oligosyltrehalose synthase [Pyrinomonadaceae bacterium]|nr:malto-oligosyltrehalose synthase [Pyrinomonadaceae bacterium]
MGNQTPAAARVPVSTYRLQFNRDFTFAEGRALAGYFDALGVTDVYSAPVLRARAGSVHGYDVIDHSRLNPEVGTDEEFAEFAGELRRRGMGLVMDVVPNHMCVSSPENRWWQDLLENGPSSPYARFFDVDWHPPNPKLQNRVLLPVLGDQYGRVLENQEVRIGYRAGAFQAHYYETQLPVAPRTSTIILSLALDDLRSQLGDAHGDVLELESVLTALRNLPQRTETEASRVRERRRETEVAKRRVARLVRESNEARRAVHDATARVNGVKGDPASFDLLEELLDSQAYRLSYWRVAAEEINYRRFFDINELAAVRVEERPVFTAVHEIIFRLMKRGLVTGLRIDHVDGLLDPEKYLNDLQRECANLLGHGRPAAASAAAAGGATFATDSVANPADESAAIPSAAGAGKGLPCYVVVEKILGHGEELRPEWPVHGTTGYDFANLLNGVFVDTSRAAAVRDFYREFTGSAVNFADLLYESKKLILIVAMSSELHVLTRRLERIAARSRYSRDFTFRSLHDALAELIACFPVYRSYVRRRHTSVGAEDRRLIQSAVRAARRHNPSLSRSLFDFVASVLLLEDPKGIAAHERNERREFVLRFQQLTSPVTAKGLEDTAFYRYYPLASLNEVGGEPDVLGVPLGQFHRANERRQARWPHTMSATSTHDSKRGEDVRARISVLSEIPEEWGAAVGRWREMNRGHKRIGDYAEIPDANEEYLLYQTLVGAWPLDGVGGEEHATFVERIQQYVNKAIKEAKLNTSWINADEDYERAVREFVDAALAAGDDNPFPADFAEFQRLTARCGMLNSLSQTLLKITAPGVPDFYQGTEVWNFSLVDPDNRRPVDYARLRSLLDSLGGAEDSAALAESLVSEPEEGRLKLFVTSRALGFRKARRELFASGDYLPLAASGEQADSAVSFARKSGAGEAIVVAGRFYTRLGVGRDGPLWRGGEGTWGDTVLMLDGRLARGRYRDAFTGAEFEAREAWGVTTLRLAGVLGRLPVALLEPVAR